ncbi:hypothetical protein L207DRAFT_569933 [Hyaloscypha variabilis F]|uniref:C2H2-type domain-containing protein n=1 Tax=Hyaloscypha variabilis (strain UAMH 11265 / GT02V1 / F) TaxID=1149755 RepID=A0A2J6RA35_HYAVF|nr:hypothetical protein L207DRAFT_569933 [Hyaloscypha variabilis F]
MSNASLLPTRIPRFGTLACSGRSPNPGSVSGPVPFGASRGCSGAGADNCLEGNTCIGTCQLSNSALSHAWQSLSPDDVFASCPYQEELVPAQSSLAGPDNRNLVAFALPTHSPQGPYADGLTELCSNLHNDISSVQGHGFEGSYSNYSNPIVHDNTQAWDFNNGVANLGLSGSMSMNQSAVPCSNNCNTETRLFASGNSQDLDYSIPLLEHNDTWEANNPSVAGTQSLDMLSLGVGQAVYEKLMSEPTALQEPVFGLSNSMPNLAADFSLNSYPLFQPSHGTFDVVVGQGLPIQQTPGQGYQHSVDLGQGQLPIASPPTLLQQHTIGSQTFVCSFRDCDHSFSRKADLARHRKTVHGVNHVKHFCQIPGCPKNQGQFQGYSRGDKLTEHMWKKHGDLGFTKNR